MDALTEDPFDVDGALAALAPAQRRLLVLHHLGELSVPQLAQVTGLPRQRVEADLTRGQSALAAALRAQAERSDRAVADGAPLS